jgi:hypothetical protein
MHIQKVYTMKKTRNAKIMALPICIMMLLLLMKFLYLAKEFFCVFNKTDVGK